MHHEAETNPCTSTAAVPAITRGEGVYMYLTRGSAGRTPPPTWGTPGTFFQDRNPASPPNPPWLPTPTYPDSDRSCTYPNPPSPPSDCRASLSPQQQLLDPATYLQSDRSAQSPTAWGRRAMDFLSSFNFRDEEPARLEGRPCGSVEELQSRLRDAFDGKVSETRAERVATRLDLAASVEMTIGAAVGDGGGRGLEGLSTLDPSLGGGAPGAADGGQAGRVVLVSEALMNQPADNPVLQRSIANQLVAGVGQVDGSEWAVREMSRATRDWVFSYVCKGSMQHWQRQHKSQAKPLVAEYSQREIDPLLASRPAFDCRGSLVISFSRNTRTISIDYDHIPLHRTVSELAALFKPPPPRRPLPNPEKQPKQPKAPKTPKQPGSSRKKKDAADKTPAGEGASKPRKRKRKTDDVGAAGEQSQSQGVAGTQAGEDGSAADQQQNGQAGQAAAQNSAAGLLIINVSPEEAERRRNVAMLMLQGAGVDPDSLSPEQFNIFANQSPELQKESLNMLVKYGAERLRIVHPGNKEGSAPPSASNTSSTPATQSNIQGSSSGPVTTNELVLQTQSPTKRSRKKSQAANNNVEEENGDSTTKTSRRKGPSKSRTACAQCKQRRVKCPRELPLCSGCRETGLICEYAPPKPKKQKSSAIVTTEDEQDENEEDETGVDEQEEPHLEDQQLQEDAEGYPDLADDSVTPQLPIGDGLGSNMGDPAADWEQGHAPPSFFHTTTMGVSEADSSQPPHQSTSVPLSNIILPTGRTYYPTISTPEIQDQTLTQPVTQEQRKKPAKAATKASGRNATMRTALPTESHSSLHSTGGSEWTGSGNPVTQAAAVVAAVVTSMQDQPPREPTYGMADSSRNNAWRPAAIPQTLDNAQQQTVAGASLQRTKTASPMNDRPRSRTAKHPKQGTVHKSPATAYQSPSMAEQHQQPQQPQQPQPQQQQQQQNAHGSGLQAPSGMAGSGSYNSYDRYSGSRAADASSNDRITYEPYSYQRDTNGTTSYTSYSHNSHSTSTTTTTAATMSSATMSSADRTGSQAYGSYSNPLSRNNTSHTSQSSHVGSRVPAQAQDYGNKSSDLARGSRQAFNMRPGQNSVKQDRGYSAYPSQIQQQHTQQQHSQQHTQHTQKHTQQASQHQAWYGFNGQSGAPFASTGGHGSNYSWNMPGDS
ncbi:hypothetical protein CCMA1212_009016 [Trichoderma ghanense]|uniref:Zn(2)-C6 fungal-type domain-containing protein n=1 Tax=Trichoderma ghanense TaxID=65468 RepID=A0ABY2GTH9_9HYPO